MRPAAPTREGAAGQVTGEELEPYLKMRDFPCAREGSVIRVGSDCSGLDSVVTALGQMGLGNRVRLEFAYDKDPRCRDFVVAVHNPVELGGDAQDRSVEDIEDMQVVDLYTAVPLASHGLQRAKERAARTSRGAVGFSTMPRRSSS